MKVYVINVLDNYALGGFEDVLVDCTEKEVQEIVEEYKRQGLDAEVVDEYEV